MLELDYETVTLYNLTIAAIDGGTVPLTGTTSVAIDITDVNDNAPQFNDQQNEILVSENVTVGAVVAMIEATDADSGSNAKISYRIITASTADAFFSIEISTGFLRTTEELDRETIDAHFVSKLLTLAAFGELYNYILDSVHQPILVVTHVNEELND